MKRRLRYYKRKGWHEIEVPGLDDGDWYFNLAKKNEAQFKEIISWCETAFPKAEYAFGLIAQNGTDRPGAKRFYFKDEKHAMWFKLKWL